MPTAKKRHRKSVSNLKGVGFEKLVREILDEGNQESGGRLTYQEKPKLKLQNGETTIPDFVVKTQTPHEERHFYIECQNRRRSTKTILHKIQHVRAKHPAKTFFYVYAQKLGAELKRAFESESIVAHNLGQFRFFIQETASFVNYNLSDIHTVRTSKASPIHARLPLPEKNMTQFNSHPDSKMLIEEFLSRGEKNQGESEASDRIGQKSGV